MVNIHLIRQLTLILSFKRLLTQTDGRSVFKISDEDPIKPERLLKTI